MAYTLTITEMTTAATWEHSSHLCYRHSQDISGDQMILRPADSMLLYT